MVNVFILNNKNRVEHVYTRTITTTYVIIIRHVLFIMFHQTIFIIPTTKPEQRVILGKNKTSC